MKYLYIYLLVISIFSIGVTVKDKICAITGKRRVSERALFILAFFGGCFGMYITMLSIRHKTRHKRFMITLPVMILVWGAGIFYLIERFV